ncbi:MAG: integrase arm-type DNA-binding domain-containing protein [Gammaproteobacteria bacterium]|nr:integrase arm-type DNA-binding domain-containing protein [Gammaproteobacteria bacterium]
MRLTKTVVDHLPTPNSGQAIYRDELLVGFGVRVTPSGVKSFIVEKRIGGRVTRKTLGRFGPLTVEQGRKEAQKFLGKVATGIDPIAEQREDQARQVTLGQVFDAYIATRSGLKASTVHDYQRIMREAFARWANRPIAQISKDDVQKLHHQLGERSPARANNAMRVLRALFNFASGQYEDSQGRSLFPENPISRISHTRGWYRVERRRTVIKKSELAPWYGAVETLRGEGPGSSGRDVGDYLLLLLFTGLRRSEGMTLRWESVDLTEQTLTITETKNREPLILPLPDILVGVLTERAAHASGEYVFPGRGGVSHLKEPRTQMNRVTEQSGVTFTLHDLRRTFITIAESLELSQYAIKQLVNHKMHNDVTAGYVVMNPERLRPAMGRIANEILLAAGRTVPSNVVPLVRKDAS